MKQSTSGEVEERNYVDGKLNGKVGGLRDGVEDEDDDDIIGGDLNKGEALAALIRFELLACYYQNLKIF